MAASLKEKLFFSSILGQFFTDSLTMFGFVCNVSRVKAVGPQNRGTSVVRGGLMSIQCVRNVAIYTIKETTAPFVKGKKLCRIVSFELVAWHRANKKNYTTDSRFLIDNFLTKTVDPFYV